MRRRDVPKNKNRKKWKNFKMTALMHLNLLKTIPSLLDWLTKHSQWFTIGFEIKGLDCG
jgi:hypothetical protein